MWQCRPPRRSVGIFDDTASRPRARRRRPRVKPNFERSVPVSMNSWVCASTPGVTRTSTSGGSPRATRRAARAGRARRRSRRRSARRRRRARPASSASDLLLPWKTIRSGGKPACSATCSSPPVATSRCEALLVDEPDHRRAEERLARVGDVAGPEVRRRTRGSGGGGRPRRRRTGASRTRRRAPRGRARAIPAGTSDRSNGASGSRRRTRSLAVVAVVEAGHLLGRVPPRGCASALGEADAAGLGEPEARLGERGVVGDRRGSRGRSRGSVTRSRGPTS